MYTEYCNYNKNIESYDDETKKVYQAIKAGVDGLALPIHLIRSMKEYLPKELLLATAIDYPCGLSSSKVRYNMVINSLNSGANCIDYVPNDYFLKEKFTELKKEVHTVLNICKDHDATFRLFLDYRKTSNIITLSQIFNGMGIDLMFPTMGYHHDDFFDNMINSKLIEDNTHASVVFNGYTWKKEQIEFLKESGIFGMRVYNLELLV